MKNLRILVFLVLVFSCKSSVPKDVFAPKKMQAVLWDVMQADEMAEYYSAKDSTYRNLSKHSEYYRQVFAIHKISKEDFSRSLSYYEEHPSRLKPILDSLKTFSERLQTADSLKKYGQSTIADSIKKKNLPANAK